MVPLEDRIKRAAASHLGGQCVLQERLDARISGVIPFHGCEFNRFRVKTALLDCAKALASASKKDGEVTSDLKIIQAFIRDRKGNPLSFVRYLEWVRT